VSAQAGVVGSEPRILAGIGLVLLGVTFLSMNDALAKYLGEFYPTAQVVFFRMLFALPLVVGMALFMAGTRLFRPRRPLFHFGRGALMALALFSFYFGVTLMPLAEAVAIVFAAPLFVTLLSIPLLGERPKPSQWVAALVGFCGVLLIVQPGTAAFTAAATLPLLTAMGYALFMLTARMIQRDESLWVSMTYVSLVPFVLSGSLLPWFWLQPAGEHMIFFVIMGGVGGLGITLITQGFRVATASVIAPFEYVGMIWAIGLGWLIWSEVPTSTTIAGILLIAGCGIHLAWSHRRRRPLPTAAPPR
jgi:drug/metabolite transporter (DMT)-like permease